MTAVLGTPITYSKPGLIKFHHEMRQRGLPRDYVNVMTMLYLITQLGMPSRLQIRCPGFLNVHRELLRSLLRIIGWGS